MIMYAIIALICLALIGLIYANLYLDRAYKRAGIYDSRRDWNDL